MPPKVENPLVIAPPKSDGQEKYPENTDQLASPDNFFRLVDSSERKHVLYRKEGAKQLIAAMSGDMPKDGDYILSRFPDKYLLFEHNKKQANGKIRTDHYLFGHPSGSRFRSTPEFIPHLLHLAALDNPQFAATETGKKHLRCTCAYCGRGGKGGSGLSSVSKTPSKASVQSLEERKAAFKQAGMEERLGEQEMSGWVYRKGELVWVWIGKEKIEGVDEATAQGQHQNWAAGIVTEKPSIIPALYMPEKGAGVFAMLDHDGPPTWDTDKNDKYTVELLGPDKASEVLEGVTQPRLRPWHSRPSTQHRKEHPTVELGRKLATTTNVFELMGEKIEPGRPNKSSWGGVFIGPEKVFIGEPVRIPRSPLEQDDTEDVMVVEKIFIETSPSPLPPDPDTGRTRLTNVIVLRGAVYTAETGGSSSPLTPEEFAGLPFRMRHCGSEGGIIKWFRRCDVKERGELSVGYILGRWYEPLAIKAWGGNLGRMPRLRKFHESRGEALGWNTFNGVQLVAPEDRRVPPKAIVANPTSSTVKDKPTTDGEDKMDVDEPGELTPPKNQFMSINAPGSTSKTSMARAAEDDDEEEMVDPEEGDEEEEEEDMEVVDAKTFGKSPTKRMAFRH